MWKSRPLRSVLSYEPRETWERAKQKQKTENNLEANNKAYET